MDIGTKQIGTEGKGGETPYPHTSKNRPAATAGEIGSVLAVASPGPAPSRRGRGRTERIRPRREALGRGRMKMGAPAMPNRMRQIIDAIRRLGAEFAALPPHWSRDLTVV